MADSCDLLTINSSKFRIIPFISISNQTIQMRTIAFLLIALLMIASQCKMANKSEKSEEFQVEDTLSIDTEDIQVVEESIEE
jgi:hypothetical protein